MVKTVSASPHSDETLLFDLKAAGDGHLVYGPYPYQWFPAGRYEATFDLALTRKASGSQATLVIEIVDNTDRYLAQRRLSADPPPCEFTLPFVPKGDELFLEFRIFAAGFADGELRFGGVKLQPARVAPSETLGRIAASGAQARC